MYGCSGDGGSRTPPAEETTHWDTFLDTLQLRTLQYFVDTMHPETGLAPDRYPSPSPSSIAAVGFALTAYPIAAERRIISRAEAERRASLTMRFFLGLPQGPQAEGVGGYKGFFYHFLKIPGGEREWKCELSTIDTALLLAGVLFCQSYFDREEGEEIELRAMADSLYFRVDWPWFMNHRAGLVTSWRPERGFGPHIWDGYDEAMILYILAIGSPVHPLPESVWDVWTRPYVWGKHYGYEYVNFPPLFGHQFSHCWIDFRGIQDDYMREKGIDYFENSRRATYAQREYGRDNPMAWRDYSAEVWGLSACDGPGDTVFVVDGLRRQFWSYRARGCASDFVEDDGTIAPYAAGSSVAFAPEICIPTLKAIRTKYGDKVWKKYGFIDAFNRTYNTEKTGPEGWFDHDYIGIDQGPMVIMLENFRSGLVWETMKKNPHIRRGLHRAGFNGGWLDSE
ncbi:Tat pathway signal protein [candidate division KSB1 bacterium]|nr:Tat pathway signal protein [candidate division KSB1 bacterium]